MVDIEVRGGALSVDMLSYLYGAVKANNNFHNNFGNCMKFPSCYFLNLLCFRMFLMVLFGIHINPWRFLSQFLSSLS